MSTETFDVKENAAWRFTVRYVNGSVMPLLIRRNDEAQFPEYRKTLSLDPREWDRLVKWVAYHRAEDALHGSDTNKP
jgi:hypothetical protein